MYKILPVYVYRNLSWKFAGDWREQHDMTRDAAHKAFTFALGATLRSLALSGEWHGVFDQVRIEVDGNGEFEIEFETAAPVC